MTGVTDPAEPTPRSVLDPLPENCGVSYVMPVLNEGEHLAAAVRAVLAQEYPGEQELVLALGASSDATNAIAAELAASDPRVRFVDNPRNDIPIGLNLAIRSSRFPVVIRVDAHAELPADYTVVAVETLRRSGAANVGGVMVAQGRTPLQRAVARAYNSPFGLGGGVYHHGEEERPADSAYLGVFRREVLESVGLYDESLKRAEDWELNSRIRSAGHLVLFTPRLKVTYWPRASLDALRRQMYATGAWRGQLVRNQGRTPLRYLPPPVVAILVGLSVVAGLFQATGLLRGRASRTANLAHAGALAYLAGVTAVGTTRMGGDALSDRVLNVAVLATMHLSWGAGFVKGVTIGALGTVDRSRLRR